MTEVVSVVVPVYRSRSTLEELYMRIDAALAQEEAWEIVFVDDASPDDCRVLLRGLSVRLPRIRLIEHERNRGQHEAVLTGIRHAGGEWIVIMDADLQDPPEAIPSLLARGREGFDAVFAERRGRYESALRTLTARAYRALLTSALPLPRGSGMFVAVRSRAAKALLTIEGPPPHVVAMLGATGVHAASIPIARRARPGGGSAYTTRARARSALLALRWAQWRRTAPEDRLGRRRHNDIQRRYFEEREKPNMLPRRSPYIERQVEELMAFAGLRAGDRVLEIGCGLGRYTIPLAERGLKITGIDIAPALLERLSAAAGTGHTIELIEADVANPPSGLRDFDAVIGFFVLHHLHDIPASTSSIHPMLRPGGRVAFLEPNAYNPLYYLQIALDRTMSWEGDRGVTRMRRGPLLRSLQRAGFDDCRLARFGFFPPVIVNRPRGAALERRLEQVPALTPFLPFQLIGALRP